MITRVSLVNLHHHTYSFFLVMRAFKMLLSWQLSDIQHSTTHCLTTDPLTYIPLTHVTSR